MKLFRRLFLFTLLLAIGGWVWAALFPNPKAVIRSQILKLARLASFSPNEGNINRLAQHHQFSALFSEEARVAVEASGDVPHYFNGREELMNAVMAARSLVNTLKAEFFDLNIEMGPRNQSALVDLTARADVNGQPGSYVQELKFTFRKTDGNWLITRVEPVTNLKL